MITFTLPLSPSINHYYSRGKFGALYLSQAGKRFRINVQEIVAAAGHPTIEGQVSVFIAVYPRNEVRQDIDNRVKSLFDALTHAGVWLDDKQVDSFTVVRRPKVKGGMLKVVICPVDGELESSAIEAIHHGKAFV